MSNLYQLWGKAEKESSPKHSALLMHITAVAASFHALIEQPSIWQSFKRMCDYNQVPISLFLFYALLHDAGKIDGQFQAKKFDDLIESLLNLSPERIAQIKELKESNHPYYHGVHGYHLYNKTIEKCLKELSFHLLLELRESKFRDNDSSLHELYFHAASSHHGTRPEESEKPFKVKESDDKILCRELVTWAYSLVDAITGWEDIKTSSEDALDVYTNPAIIRCFEGWLSLSDWIGSSTIFPWIVCSEFEANYSKTNDLVALYQGYKKIALEFIDDLGIFSLKVPKNKYYNAVMDQYTPTPLQQVVVDQPIKEGELIICEAAMGNGKTEFAMLAASDLLSQNKVGGIAFALPSQASSNNMYKRLNAISNIVIGKNARLEHSSAGLVLNEQVGDNNDEANSHWCDWLLDNNKKAFLTPLTVCTIDQFELAQMSSKHNFLRFACLSRQVVIIDEIHAYDGYIHTIIKNLLAFLGGAKTPVILMSATLPQYKKLEFINAYREGLGLGRHIENNNQRVYPLVTRVHQDEVINIPISSDKKKHAISWVKNSNWISEITKHPEKCSGVICNTKKSAIMRFTQLIDLQNKGNINQHIKIILLHSDYRPKERRQIEQRLDDILGKQASNRSPCIVIATQVIEQSLDYDFDHLFSEVSPIDLLMQRLGRQHRHPRDELGFLQKDGVDKRKTPVFTIIMPDTYEEAWFQGSLYIYSEDGDKINDTIKWIKKKSPQMGTATELTLPDDINHAVQDVYPYNQGTDKKAKSITRAESRTDSLGQNARYKSSNTRDADPSETFIFVIQTEDGLILPFDNTNEVFDQAYVPTNKFKLMEKIQPYCFSMTVKRGQNSSYQHLKNHGEIIAVNGTEDHFFVISHKVNDQALRLTSAGLIYSQKVGLYNE